MLSSQPRKEEKQKAGGRGSLSLSRARILRAGARLQELAGPYTHSGLLPCKLELKLKLLLAQRSAPCAVQA